MTTAITGATGQLGRLVIDQLKKRQGREGLLALARRPERASDLGVTVREADYDRPETLTLALTNVERLLLISASEFGNRAVQHERVIAAAASAGVKRIVYTSLLHADTSPLPLAQEHRDTEGRLAACGLEVTILRNGWYTENYTGNLAGALEHGAILGSAGDGRISCATRLDYAEAAAVVLASDGHAGKVYELAGDDAFTLSELAAEVSRLSGKNIAYRDLPEAEFAGVLQQVGLPQPVAQLLANCDALAAAGALFDDSRTLSSLIGRPTTPLAEAVRVALDVR